MKKYLCLLVLAFALCLGGCETSGPGAALDRMADALEKNNPAQFLAEIDMSAYASNYLKNMTSSEPTLNSLNELGNLLGLGSLDKLIGSLVDAKARIKSEFERGVASGELVAQCGQALSPDCPWVPAALRNAKIVELGPNAAIARIITPTRITSWLAMRKNGENWQVVGRAVLENEATAMAQTAPSAPASTSGNNSTEI